MTTSASAGRALAVAAIGTALLSMVAGCQNGFKVSALNRCGHAVEARVDEVRDFTVGWIELGVNERVHMVAAADSTTKLYVQVRTAGIRPIQFTVVVAELPKPPEGIDDDVEIVLEGDRCPPPAG